ncbi:MAG: hypothetical protein LBL99_02470 [Holosporaceae bacterium]|jgi:hypothetical protein|nr:hypothetical protein [Holosporaceae bacterium]
MKNVLLSLLIVLLVESPAHAAILAGASCERDLGITTTFSPTTPPVRRSQRDAAFAGVSCERDLELTTTLSQNMAPHRRSHQGENRAAPPPPAQNLNPDAPTAVQSGVRNAHYEPYTGDKNLLGKVETHWGAFLRQTEYTFYTNESGALTSAPPDAEVLYLVPTADSQKSRGEWILPSLNLTCFARLGFKIVAGLYKIQEQPGDRENCALLATTITRGRFQLIILGGRDAAATTTTYLHEELHSLLLSGRSRIGLLHIGLLHTALPRREDWIRFVRTLGVEFDPNAKIIFTRTSGDRSASDVLGPINDDSWPHGYPSWVPPHGLVTRTHPSVQYVPALLILDEDQPAAPGEAAVHSTPPPLLGATRNRNFICEIGHQKTISSFEVKLLAAFMWRGLDAEHQQRYTSPDLFEDLAREMNESVHES